jgi:hypothetical protein
LRGRVVIDLLTEAAAQLALKIALVLDEWTST